MNETDTVDDDAIALALKMLRGNLPWRRIRLKTGLSFAEIDKLRMRVRSNRVSKGDGRYPRNNQLARVPRAVKMLIQFTRTPPYQCDGCGKQVKYVPCVVCVAQRQRRESLHKMLDETVESV